MSYEAELNKIEERFVDAVGRYNVDRYDDRIVVEINGGIVQITGENRCIVGASTSAERHEIRGMVREALDPNTGREDAFPRVAKQQLDGYENCDSCGKLKDAPESFPVLERAEHHTTAICWDCHKGGRST